MLTREDPFVAIDIDHCIHDGSLPETVQSFIERFDSYTELSPSGKGIRIMIKGTLPTGVGNRFTMSGTKGVELYEHSRYVTITGQVLNNTIHPIRRLAAKEWSPILACLGVHTLGVPTSCSTAPQNTAQSKEDQRVIDQLMRDEKYGMEFRALFEFGDIAPFGGDQSKADLRLAMLISNKAGFDEARIDRIVRSSKLYRKKWDSRHRHDGATYGQMTIEKALERRFIRHHSEIEDFLQFTYTFRFNEVRSMVEWKPRDGTLWAILDDRGFASVYRHVINKRGKISESGLHSLLKSDFCPVYNPFVEFFNGLPVKKGTSEIEKLIATVTTEDPEYFRATFLK